MPGQLSAVERETLYTEYLSAEGYTPDLETDGVVCFTKGDLHLHLPVGEDPDYFVVSLLDVMTVEDEAERSRVVRAANVVAAESKVAKVCLSQSGKVTINIELFCAPADAFKSIFARCLSELETAQEKFLTAYGS